MLQTNLSQYINMEEFSCFFPPLVFILHILSLKLKADANRCADSLFWSDLNPKLVT